MRLTKGGVVAHTEQVADDTPAHLQVIHQPLEGARELLPCGVLVLGELFKRGEIDRHGRKDRVHRGLDVGSGDGREVG